MGKERLKKWIEARDLTHEAFAAMIGCDRTMVGSMLSGRRMPGRTTALLIEKITKGAVMAEAWDRAPRKKRGAA